MIAQLSGNVADIGATWLVMDVGGVGFYVQATPNTTATLRTNQQVTIFTTMVVREDAMKLYGFAERADRACFELCLSASGIGPKLALAILSVLSPHDFATAVRSEDLTKLCAVPGIGKKGAQKIIIELRDKVDALLTGLPASAVTPSRAMSARQDQVLAGLESLGWSAKDAEAAFQSVADLTEQDPDISVAALMKAALASLARV